LRCRNEPDLLKLLPYAAEAAFDSYDKRHDPLCLPDTRVDVLNQIRSWADRQDQRCIFWLYGLAGTGKSTIARTIAGEYYKQGRLGASFFFSKGSGDVSHAGKFFTSVAIQLASRLPSFKRSVCEAISEHHDIASKGLRDQWNQLIFRPLFHLSVGSPQSPFIVVIDALDECEGDNDIRLILQLLAETNGLETTRLQIFLTSRPETPVRLGFRAMPRTIYRDLALHNTSRAAVDHDITIFLRDEFKQIRDTFEDLPANWPGDEKIKYLVQRADGLFIYAATICRFIKGDGQWLPQKLLDLVVLDNSSSHSPNEEYDIPSTSPTWELDEMYSQLLQHSFEKVKEEKDKERLFETFRRIIGSFIILFEPLSATTLAKLLHTLQETVNLRVRHLYSVLNVPENQSLPIRLLHSSFRDFLLDNQRCHNQSFGVDEKQTHKTLANHCVQLMSETLKQDICGLHTPGILAVEVDSNRVKHCICPEVQYACFYWVQHLRRSEIQLYDDDQVHQFLREHLLHWLETLSLLGKTSEGVRSISSLETYIQVSRLNGSLGNSPD
jgi:hypothetical protein